MAVTDETLPPHENPDSSTAEARPAAAGGTAQTAADDPSQVCLAGDAEDHFVGYRAPEPGGDEPDDDAAAFDEHDELWADDDAEADPERKLRRSEREDDDPNAIEGLRTARDRQRALMVGVLASDEDLTELAELLKTAGVEVVGQIVQHREGPHPHTYVGAGKVNEVRALAKELDANIIVTDDELSPRQERSLEELLKVAVLDRTALILDIFAAHAHSAEGKLQVELAQLQYNLARMRGLWTHLDRLVSGGVGTRGPGETQIETDRRIARSRISQLRRRLKDVEEHRATMRAERARTDLPSLALAGYTNAGKSTLLHALSGAEISTGDQLFHTLDPATRTARLGGRNYLITDTVGFIRKLPHQLVDAFGATLTETKLAELVLHVVDASEEDEMRAGTIKTVEDVLDEIGAGERPRLLVLNKIDRVSAEDRAGLKLIHPDAVQVSAVTGEGIEALIEAIQQSFEKTIKTLELLIPHSEGGIVAELYGIDDELVREDVAEGVRVTARVPVARASRYERFAAGGSVPAA